MHFQLRETSDKKFFCTNAYYVSINIVDREVTFLSQFFHGVQFVYEAKYLTKYNLPPLKVVGLEGKSLKITFQVLVVTRSDSQTAFEPIF